MLWQILAWCQVRQLFLFTLFVHIMDNKVSKTAPHERMNNIIGINVQRIHSLQWCHNECDGVSNHQPRHCLLNCLFRRRSKKTSKLRVTCLCAGNSLVTGEFPAQMASNGENVSMTSSWVMPATVMHQVTAYLALFKMAYILQTTLLNAFVGGNIL